MTKAKKTYKGIVKEYSDSGYTVVDFNDSLFYHFATRDELMVHIDYVLQDLLCEESLDDRLVVFKGIINPLCVEDGRKAEVTDEINLVHDRKGFIKCSCKEGDGCCKCDDKE